MTITAALLVSIAIGVTTGLLNAAIILLIMSSMR